MTTYLFTPRYVLGSDTVTTYCATPEEAADRAVRYATEWECEVEYYRLMQAEVQPDPCGWAHMQRQRELRLLYAPSHAADIAVMEECCYYGRGIETSKLCRILLATMGLAADETCDLFPEEV
jgi:hypothetical protein